MNNIKKDEFDLSIIRKGNNDYWISIMGKTMNKGMIMKMDLQQIIQLRDQFNEWIGDTEE